MQYCDPSGRTTDNNFFDMDPWGDPNLPRPHPHLPQNDVGRMYIEYCPGGDLEQMHEKNPQGRQWAEEEIWRLLECLARGAVVMDSGTENPQTPANIWAQPVFPAGYVPAEIDPRRPICHFDLKPANSTLTNVNVILFIADSNRSLGCRARSKCRHGS